MESVFEEFYDQPTLEADIVPEFGHMEFMDLYDEDFDKFIQWRSVKYKAPIEIPKVSLPIIEEPILDQVFEREIFFTKDEQSRIMFPEDTYVSMYKSSLKHATLESFLDDQWDEEFRNKVQSFYQNFGIQDMNDSTPIARFLTVYKQLEHGLEIIRFGAERRDKSLIEFTQYDIYNLRLQDKISLLAYGVQIGDSEIVSEVRRVMGIYIRNLIKHDFQLGLESKLNKVNLLERSKINLPLGNKVFSSPELGFLYETSSEVAAGFRVFLVSDIPKYSTSTLNWISEKLETLIGPQELKREISFLIKERIQFRNLVIRSYASGHTRINTIREADYIY